MSEIRVETIEGADGFASLRGEWHDLSERARGTVFSRWEWLFAWWSRLACRANPVLLAARDGAGTLRGLLPLLEERSSRLRVSRWSLLGDRWVGSDGLLPVLDREWAGPAGAALAQELALAAQTRWHWLRLAGLPSDSPWIAVLRRGLRQRGIDSWQIATDVCPFLRLAPAGDPLAHNPRRETFARRQRWLRRQPSFRIDSSRDAPALDVALTGFFALHDRRWRSASDAIAGPRIEGFHREAAALLAERGLCRLYSMSLQGRLVAAVHAFVDRDVFYYYLPAFDPAWAHRSVGTVLLGTLVTAAQAEGFRRFELLRGEEPYKEDWADARWSSCTVNAIATGPSAGAIAGLLRWQRSARAVASRLSPEAAVWRWRGALSRLSLRTADMG